MEFIPEHVQLPTSYCRNIAALFCRWNVCYERGKEIDEVRCMLLNCSERRGGRRSPILFHYGIPRDLSKLTPSVNHHSNRLECREGKDLVRAVVYLRVGSAERYGAVGSNCDCGSIEDCHFGCHIQPPCSAVSTTCKALPPCNRRTPRGIGRCRRKPDNPWRVPSSQSTALWSAGPDTEGRPAPHTAAGHLAHPGADDPAANDPGGRPDIARHVGDRPVALTTGRLVEGPTAVRHAHPARQTFESPPTPIGGNTGGVQQLPEFCAQHTRPGHALTPGTDGDSRQ